MALIPQPLPVHSRPDDRDAIIDWARGLLQHRDFVILDTETTGLKSTDEVIQIGIIDADGKSLLDSLVKPEKPRRMPPKALEVHGITIKMLQTAPTFFELCPQIISSIGSRLVVCYNDAFDMRLLQQTAQKYDLPRRGYRLDLQSQCAMLAYSQFIGTPRQYSQGPDYMWQRLPRLTAEHHDAFADCLLTLQLIQEIAGTPKQGETTKVDTRTAPERGRLSTFLPITAALA